MLLAAHSLTASHCINLHYTWSGAVCLPDYLHLVTSFNRVILHVVAVMELQEHLKRTFYLPCFVLARLPFTAAATIVKESSCTFPDHPSSF